MLSRRAIEGPTLTQLIVINYLDDIRRISEEFDQACHNFKLYSNIELFDKASDKFKKDISNLEQHYQKGMANIKKFGVPY